ncbi:hypothetical protein SALBM311S_10112 [Streptomyces alboniger]
MYAPLRAITTPIPTARIINPLAPSHGKSNGKVFLPFEDYRLSLIVSKAFLLAADTKTTDETIDRQLKRDADEPRRPADARTDRHELRTRGT